MEQVVYVVIDPGETSGVAEFSATGKVLGMHQYKIKELYSYLVDLSTMKPHYVIFEEYKIFSHKAASHTNSKVPTLQVIGAIKFAAWQAAAVVVEQPSQAKVIGYRYAEMTVPKNHALSHGPDAVAHGYYYLVKQGVIKLTKLGGSSGKTKETS